MDIIIGIVFMALLTYKAPRKTRISVQDINAFVKSYDILHRKSYEIGFFTVSHASNRIRYSIVNVGKKVTAIFGCVLLRLAVVFVYFI